MNQRTKLKLHIGGSILGFVGGVVGFLVFVFGYYNYNAGIWSLLAGVMSFICLHLNFTVWHETLQDHYNTKILHYLKYFGFFMLAASVVAIVSYLIITVVDEIPMMPVGPSTILAAVQAFLTMKWSIMTIITAKKYKTQLENIALLAE